MKYKNTKLFPFKGKKNPQRYVRDFYVVKMFAYPSAFFNVLT